MGIRGLSVAVVLVTLLWGCSTHYGAPVSGRAVNPAAKFHIVTRDETLFSISWMYGHDYHDVAIWNGIAEPYNIHAGQRLSLRPSARQPSTAARPQSGRKSSARKQEIKPSAAAEAESRPVSRWIWPAQGTLLRRFSQDDAGKKGIAISGRTRQSVVASAAGKVVYSGSGLLRYGKLIIIKHNGTYLSAYAHNRRLLVKEGEFVKTGQQIAEMGDTGTDRTMLHFEIRRNGKPVDPLKYLPKRGNSRS